MRMLLTSNGIANDVIREALVDLLDKPLAESRVIVVIDAILGFPGDSSTLVEHLESLRSLGWAEFDVASLFAGPPSLVESRLRSADAIIGYGGSNLWAAHAWRATGLAPVLEQLLHEKVYIGWSAGSMIFSRCWARIQRAGPAVRTSGSCFQLPRVLSPESGCAGAPGAPPATRPSSSGPRCCRTEWAR